RVDFVSGAEMLLRQQQIFLAEIYQTEMIKRRIELRIHLYAATQVTNCNIGSTVFQVSAANKVVHLRRRFEPERAFQMGERFVHFALAHQNPAQPIMSREGVLLDLQRAAQVPLGRVQIAIVAADYAEHEKRKIVVRFAINRALKVSASEHRLVDSEKVLAYEEGKRFVRRV